MFKFVEDDLEMKEFPPTFHHAGTWLSRFFFGFKTQNRSTPTIPPGNLRKYFMRCEEQSIETVLLSN